MKFKQSPKGEDPKCPNTHCYNRYSDGGCLVGETDNCFALKKFLEMMKQLSACSCPAALK